MPSSILLALLLALSPAAAQPPTTTALAAASPGYYRQPAISSNRIVFVSEGDLWKVPLAGGVATRLTSHPGDETLPAISPDGKTVAFTAEYESGGGGPLSPDVYTMPISGGQPRRLTFDNRGNVAGWTNNGQVVVASDKFSTLPNAQLSTIDPGTGVRTIVPLWQASDGAFDPATGKLAFVRLPFQSSSTKRYKGGFIQQLWIWDPTADGGKQEATALAADFAGTSKHPMWWQGRIYFLTDRDGHMNIWSMLSDGKDVKQHTTHSGMDVQGGALAGGKLVYQVGADLWLLDIASNKSTQLGITLESDFDQLRERWVDKPADFITSASPSGDGDRVAITARGRIFVAPAKNGPGGRVIDVLRDDTARYRSARFMPDGKKIVALSDKTGELEIYTAPANGVTQSPGLPAEQLTADGTVLRWDAIPSPDSKLIAHFDKNQKLWVLDIATKTSILVDTNKFDDFTDVRWSTDSKWIAYVNYADNIFRTIKFYSIDSKTATAVTSDRYDSYSPAWSVDGKYLYFLTDRNLRTLANSPWGPYAPKPFLTETTKIMALALQPLKEGERFPFSSKDELAADKSKDKDKEKDKDKTKEPEKPAEKKPQEPKPNPDLQGQPASFKIDPAKTDSAKAEPAKDDKPKADEKKPEVDAKAPKKVEINLDGIAIRLFEVPVPSGNYSALSANEKSLFLLATDNSFDAKNDLRALEIKNQEIEFKTVAADVTSFELTADGKKMLIRKKDAMYIIDASPAPAAELEKSRVNLTGWTFSFQPRQQWKQMYSDAWRLMRDYFYDVNMHGVDWPAMKAKYAPLIERIATRAELNDVLAQMVGELSALHHFVRGGDGRTAPAVDRAPVGSLGAILQRDQAAGGFAITRIYRNDPDDPSRAAPLAKPEVRAQVGDIIELVDGIPALSVRDLGELLRQKVGKQVLLRLKPKSGEASAESRDVIVVPISQDSENDLRYGEWQLTRREAVEKASSGKIGYVHLRAMGGENYTEWARGYFPAFNREGLIIDVRNNRGGNIDSWILGELMRKGWFNWSPRVGQASWNMQYAFRGHVTVLCNERTASDGEAFAEGIRRLGIGKVIGVRTWGGEIWLSSSNLLLDKGIASAAETGVFGPEGTWLIEGHGVDPDITVDNLPRATFDGADAQLDAAIAHLAKLIAEKPIPAFTTPNKPDKSSPDNKRK